MNTGISPRLRAGRRMLLRLGLGQAVAGLAAGSAHAFDPWRQSALYEIEYRVDLSGLAGSGPLRLWLPGIPDTPDQRVVSMHLAAPWPYRETRDEHGNRLFYLEATISEGAPAEVVAHTLVQRQPARGIDVASLRRSGRPGPESYLAAAKRIPLDGAILEIAEREARGLTTDAQKIRAYYYYVVRTMRYSKTGEGWGNGDAIWACSARYGNCTDFHSLFIGLVRSQGIPARFVIGFPIRADRQQMTVPGYHCWAEAFDAARGWLPMDASEAKKSGRSEDYFGRLPSDRVEFTVGRDLQLEPRQDAGPVNFFIHPYAERGGEPVGKLPLIVRARRLPAQHASR